MINLNTAFHYLKKRYGAGLHVFDLVSMIAVVVIVASLLFFFRRQNEYVQITLKMTDDDVYWEEGLLTNEFTTLFETGTKKYDASGNVIVEILDVQTANSGRLEDKRAVYLTLRLQTTFNKNTKQYSHNGSVLLVGSRLEIEMENALIKGLIAGIGDESSANRFENRWIEMTVKLVRDTHFSAFTSLDSELLTNYHGGMKRYGSNGSVEVEVKKVYKTGKNLEDQIPVYVDLGLMATFDTVMQRYYYDGEVLVKGGYISTEADNTKLNGVITSIGEKKQASQDVELIVELQALGENAQGVLSYIPNGIGMGEMIKAIDGEVVAEVVNKWVEPAKIVTVDNLGVPHLYNNPMSKYLHITLKMKAEKIDGTYWFMGTQQIMINNNVDLEFDKLRIKMTIIDLKEQL